MLGIYYGAELSQNIMSVICFLILVIKPDLYTHEDTVEGYVGKSLQLQCYNSFEPRPMLSWTKIDGNMPEASRVGYQISQSVLTINGAKLSDAGQYQCHAKNDAGEDVLTMKLIIYGKTNTLLNVLICVIFLLLFCNTSNCLISKFPNFLSVMCTLCICLLYTSPSPRDS